MKNFAVSFGVLSAGSFSFSFGTWSDEHDAREISSLACCSASSSSLRLTICTLLLRVIRSKALTSDVDMSGLVGMVPSGVSYIPGGRKLGRGAQENSVPLHGMIMFAHDNANVITSLTTKATQHS